MFRCFFHNDKPAVTKCSSCHKPLCQQCKIETEYGGVCSIDCKEKMKEFFERYPDGKIGDIRTHGYLWFRIKSLLKIMIVLAVFYLFMYLKYDLTNPVDIIKKIGEWLKSILF